MGQKQVFLCVCMFAIGTLALLSKAGGPARQLGISATGAPGELTCVACHDNDGGGGGDIRIESAGLGAGYEPGSIYTIRVRISDSNAGVGGFQMVALDGSSQNAGTLVASSAFQTQTTSLPTTFDNIYLEHQTPRLFTAGETFWDFTWEAPMSSVGPVHFYAAGIAADWSSTPSGDDVYLTQMVIATLPVEFVGFTAAPQKSGAILLEWATASELNSDHFELERSLDANFFTRIGSTPAAGNSSDLLTYQFMDFSPVFGEKNYYRIKEIDKDGKYHYSSTLTVKVEDPVQGLQHIFPNPAILAQEITSSYLVTDPGNVEFRLFDMSGHSVAIVREAFPSGLHQVKIPVSGLPSGTYYLETHSGDTYNRKQVIIAN